MTLPTPDLAASIATRLFGVAPTRITRFTTGSRHYVYDVVLPSRSVVIRIGDATAHAEMAGAVHLSGLLRPLGVPLPELHGSDVGCELPWMALERLSGTDLGAVHDDLGTAWLAAIAEAIAHAQARVATLPGAGRYGYAVTPEAAPHRRWTDVLRAHYVRSRDRIRAAGLFDPTLADTLLVRIDTLAPMLDAIPPTPFLHDTTTKNVIVGPDGALSGIVDVDDLCFGDPRYVVALTETSLRAAGRDTGYTAAWRSAAGYDEDAAFRLYVALFLFDFMAEHGQVFNGNQQPSAPAARAHLLALFGATTA